MKEQSYLVSVGFVLCMCGEILRKRAIYVCGQNFDHIVQYDLRNRQHSLVTHDVYSLVQHPSYTGWFIFTIGTQVWLTSSNYHEH